MKAFRYLSIIGSFVILGFFAPDVTGAKTTTAPLRLPTAIDGTACHWATYTGGPIGMVLPTLASLQPDIPGPRGNEISQVYRIFSVAGDWKDGMHTLFVGWLLRSYSREYDFVPKGVNGALRVAVKDPDHLPLNAWLDSIRAMKLPLFAGNLKNIMAHRYDGTALSPCFRRRGGSKR